MKKRSSGFTIVELLVVVIVIGILAAMTIVSFSGVQSRAVSALLQSDLANASRTIRLFQVENNDNYPDTIDCAAPDSSTNRCVRLSEGVTYVYLHDNNSSPKTFSLTVTKNNISYRIKNDAAMVAVRSCPTGFIVVPGSATYGTSEFCVMKYEAKDGGGGVAVSQAAGLPWINANRIQMSTYAQGACTNCHLITEAEWLTIAQNVLSVPSNWSSGIVGTGYIYSGHNDCTPSTIQAADTDDGNGYVNTSNTTGSNQRRTLTLTNGEVIWDFAGNAYEWTQGDIINQPGLVGESAYAWKEWTNGSLQWRDLPSIAKPSSTGLSGSSGWNASYGVGKLYSNYAAPVTTYSYVRSGSWCDPNNAGVLSLYLYFTPSGSSPYLGFRVVQP